jgi:hypothetical protein
MDKVIYIIIFPKRVRRDMKYNVANGLALSCSRCGKELSESNWPQSLRKLHLHWCLDCKRKAGREASGRYYHNHPEKVKEQNRRYEAEHKERMIELRRLGQLRRKYGITSEEFNSLASKQNGACAVCKTSFRVTKPNVDHDHVTGRVRGLLCDGCNWAVGAFESRRDGILSYLEMAT